MATNGLSFVNVPSNTASVHRSVLLSLDDPTFAPLIECQARAGDLRLALSRALSERRPINMKQAQDLMQPFENLMILVQDRGALSEPRWEELEANVARILGRPLVTAAARRRLSVASAEPQTEAAPTPLPIGAG